MKAVPKIIFRDPLVLEIFVVFPLNYEINFPQIYIFFNQKRKIKFEK